jgi:hypothetical protein
MAIPDIAINREVIRRIEALARPCDNKAALHRWYRDEMFSDDVNGSRRLINARRLGATGVAPEKQHQSAKECKTSPAPSAPVVP